MTGFNSELNLASVISYLIFIQLFTLLPFHHAELFFTSFTFYFRSGQV